MYTCIYYIALLAFQGVLLATIYTNSPPCTVCNHQSTITQGFVNKYKMMLHCTLYPQG